ncbi:MAG: hypothetical protein JW803_08915 [Endomicrobiales bacterium]|nr:hypothetical protein [Endomicrobiales bacterium]
MKKLISVLLAGAMLSSTAAFAAERPVFIRGVRPLGMGGAFVALSDDQNAIFYNPAGITQRQGSLLTAVELSMNASQDIFDFVNFYNDNKDDMENFDDLAVDRKVSILNEINDNITTYKPALRVGFPNTSWISGGQGFLSYGGGLFMNADLGFQFNRSLLVPNISFWGNVDTVGAVPLAHKFKEVPYIPGSLSVGGTVKLINRGRIAEYNKSILEFEEFDPQVQYGQGFGFDIGTLYQLNSRWNFGLQITDVGGTSLKFDKVTASEAGQVDKEAFTGMINSEWNVGAAYVPSKITYWPGRHINTRDRVILLCDVRDVLSTDERLLEDTFFKKLHLGAEFRWGPASLRGGFNSGYPTIGLGARVPYLGLKADYAFWTDELGRYAGQIPESNHLLTLSLSWGDSKGRAYGKDAASAAKPLADTAKPAVKPKPAPAAPAVPKQELEADTTRQTGIMIDASESTTTRQAPATEPAAGKPAPEKVKEQAAPAGKKAAEKAAETKKPAVPVKK